MLAALPGRSALAVAAQGGGLQGCIGLEVPLPHQVRALCGQGLAQAHSEAAAWTEGASSHLMVDVLGMGLIAGSCQWQARGGAVLTDCSSGHRPSI